MSGSVLLTGLAFPASSQADDGCAAGMYFNWDTNQCEYYDDLTVYVDPCCYIPGPVGIGPIGPGPVGPGPIGPGPVGPGPVGPGPVGPGPIFGRR
ncbi:hypothetical protein [Mycolicibacterium hodleri]|uniref:hypothetical protein n=1 Tax=Mycolicibacterium hodleri TaxID=49897 RepID=UPI001375FFA6|nr:hypothetical protein [Mycolicibacterium hodleri]